MVVRIRIYMYRNKRVGHASIIRRIQCRAGERCDLRAQHIHIRSMVFIEAHSHHESSSINLVNFSNGARFEIWTLGLVGR